jgi:hypothetical protein
VDTRIYVGSTVLVKTRDDKLETEYRLTGVSPDNLELLQRKGSEATTFHIQSSEIENIRVLINQDG